MSDYNGWSNYETWAVHLWMDNEESSQKHWARRAMQLFNLDDIDGSVSDLAREMKSDHEDMLPSLDGFAADLLNAAFGEVDWYEIAESYIDEAKRECEEEDANG
jgi:hypothetical protein